MDSTGDCPKKDQLVHGIGDSGTRKSINCHLWQPHCGPPFPVHWDVRVSVRIQERVPSSYKGFKGFQY
uniref:Uncharacterized protein n=1 Tax=mine drainage metagenome TaxID=410659 RepID=E6Q8W4_9ZZZZ